MSQRERRSMPRHVCQLRVSVATEGGVLHGRSADLSATGIRVLLEQPLDKGTEVVFLLSLVLGFSEGNFLQLPGKIVWCNRTDRGHLLGGEFQELDEDRRQRLDVLLRVLAGALSPMQAVSDN